MGNRTLSRALGAALVAGGLVAVQPAPAAAQGSTSLGLYGGLFTPLGSDIDLGGVAGTVRRDNSIIGGARLSIWGSRILGLELVAGYSPARAEVAGAPINSNRNLNIFTGGAKLMLGISPGASPIGFHVGAGPALIRRGTDVTAQSSSSTDFGAVVGGGVRLPLSGGIAIRADAEDYIYKGSFGSSSDQTRNDLVLSTGLSFRF